MDDKNIENIVMMDTINATMFCFGCGRYIFDKEIEVTIQQFEGEDYRFPMYGCKRHPFEKRTHYRRYN